MNGPNDRDAIEDQAGRWIIRREDRVTWSEEDAADLQSWLDSSFAHKAAFWRLEFGWDEADRVACIGTASESRWTNSLQKAVSHTVSFASRRRIAAATAAALVLFGSASLLWNPRGGVHGGNFSDFRTPVREMRSLVLADGSRIDLNTETRVRVRASAHDREVWLDRGEAFFDVAHQAGRKFVVHAGSRTITVLGTRFFVQVKDAGVTVGVLSGRVRVDGGETALGSAGPTFVPAGNIAVSEPQATIITASDLIRIDQMASWRRGVLVFDDTPLGEAAAQFNRYNSKVIHITDPELAALKVGGTFRVQDGDAFISLLQNAYGLHVRNEHDAVVIDH